VSRGARVVALLLFGAAPLAAQHGGIGPVLGLADYREVSASLRYRGIGPGVSGSFVFHRLSVDGVALWLQMTPQAGGQATQGFRAVQLDGWARFRALDYLTFEVGFTRRTPDSAFAAQSVGAVRIGARTQYALGHGAAMSLRGDYLAGARFSGGGSAPLALEVGLGLDLVFSRHVRAALDYSFQRLDRKTNPGGGPQANAPVEQALGHVGFTVGL
jgi:hypothetical protein